MSKANIMKVKFKNTITNNFNNEIIYTSSTGRDLKNDVRSEARKHNKEITDFTITKLWK